MNVHMNAPILTASHYGVVRFGDLDCEAVVLTTGECGHVRKQVAKLLGLHENNTGHRFRQILADFSPKSLSELDKFESPISLPSGRRAQFFPAGVITRIASDLSRMHQVLSLVRAGRPGRSKEGPAT